MTQIKFMVLSNLRYNKYVIGIVSLDWIGGFMGKNTDRKLIMRLKYPTVTKLQKSAIFLITLWRSALTVPAILLYQWNLFCIKNVHQNFSFNWFKSTFFSSFLHGTDLTLWMLRFTETPGNYILNHMTT